MLRKVSENRKHQFTCILHIDAPAALISTPADVVKTRLQQARDVDETSEASVLLGKIEQHDDYQNHHHLTPIQVQLTSDNQLTLAPNGKESASFFSVMGTITKDEGPEVLFSGWFERVVRSVPQFGVTLAMFDLLDTYAVNHGWLLEQTAH